MSRDVIRFSLINDQLLIARGEALLADPENELVLQLDKNIVCVDGDRDYSEHAWDGNMLVTMKVKYNLTSLTVDMSTLKPFDANKLRMTRYFSATDQRGRLDTFDFCLKQVLVFEEAGEVSWKLKLEEL